MSTDTIRRDLVDGDSFIKRQPQFLQSVCRVLLLGRNNFRLVPLAVEGRRKKFNIEPNDELFSDSQRVADLMLTILHEGRGMYHIYEILGPCQYGKNLLGMHFDDGRIEIYKDSFLPEEYETLSIITIIHELSHAVMCPSNYIRLCDNYSREYRSRRYEMPFVGKKDTTMYSGVYNYLDTCERERTLDDPSPLINRSGLEPMNFYHIREESLANTLTFRIVYLFHNRLNYENGIEYHKKNQYENWENELLKASLKKLQQSPNEYRLAEFMLPFNRVDKWVEAKTKDQVSLEKAKKWARNTGSQYSFFLKYSQLTGKEQRDSLRELKERLEEMQIIQYALFDTSRKCAYGYKESYYRPGELIGVDRYSIEPLHTHHILELSGATGEIGVLDNKKDYVMFSTTTGIGVVCNDVLSLNPFDGYEIKCDKYLSAPSDDGYIMKSKDGLFGVWKLDGFVVPCSYHSIDKMDKGMYLVCKDSKYGVFNIGSLRFDLQLVYDSIQKKGAYYIVKNGKNEKYYFDGLFYDEIKNQGNYLIVKQGGLFGLYKSQNQILPIRYKSIEFYSFPGYDYCKIRIDKLYDKYIYSTQLYDSIRYDYNSRVLIGCINGKDSILK